MLGLEVEESLVVTKKIKSHQHTHKNQEDAGDFCDEGIVLFDEMESLFQLGKENACDEERQTKSHGEDKEVEHTKTQSARICC